MTSTLTLTQFSYGVLSGMLPALLWLWFWLREDNIHPEPRARIAQCFLAGMGAVFVALFFQWLTMNVLPNVTIRYIVWASIEESAKFLVAYLVALRMGVSDEPIDMLVYMITVALGFSALENTLFMLGAFNTGDYVTAIITSDMRFMGASIVHVVSSASIGFMLAISFYRSQTVRFFAGLAGLAIAVALHSSFNLSIITATGTNTFKVFAWFWCAVVILMILFEEIKTFELKHDKINSQRGVYK